MATRMRHDSQTAVTRNSLQEFMSPQVSPKERNLSPDCDVDGITRVSVLNARNN